MGYADKRGGPVADPVHADSAPVVAAQRARLDQSQSQLPGLLRFLLVVGVIFFIVLSYPASLEDRHMRLLTVGAIVAFLFLPSPSR